MKRQLFSLAALVASGAIILGLLPSSASATVPGDNAAISISSSGGNPNSSSGNPDASQDGRYVAFQSEATNLVSPATSGNYQIYVRDRLNSTTTLVSVASDGTRANDRSVNPRISENGRYIVFDSAATNLVSGDTNGKVDYFIHDMDTGTTKIVDTNASGVEANQGGGDGDISADGQYVVFDSSSTNLVSSPAVTTNSVFLKNMSTGEVKLLSQSPSGEVANTTAIEPRISCEGRFVIFQSNANNLVPGDTGNPNKLHTRIYLVDILGSGYPIYIKGDANGSMANSSISCNGNYLGFASDASNLVSGDTNSHYDAFVYDRINDSYDLVSVSSSGSEGNADTTDYPSVSNDGKYVVFSSSATNLISSDTNGMYDIFLRDRQAGTTELITRDASGNMGNGNSFSAVLSSDGRYAAYYSNSSNLVSGYNYGSGSIYESRTGATDDY